MKSLRQSTRFKQSLLSSIVLVAVLLLAACQPQASANQSTSTPATTDTVAAVTAAPAMTDTAGATGTVMTTDTVAATMAATDTPAATSMASDTPAAMTSTPAAMTGTPAATTGTPAAGITPTVALTLMTTTTINTSSNSTLGNFLVDSNGMTLYIFKKDTADTSACTGGCLSVWPPLTAASGAAPSAGTGVTGTLAVITRPDGIQQVTYNHQPLYYYSADKATGDTKGQGVANNWYVVAP